MNEWQGWPVYYDELLQMVDDSNRWMMQRITEERRKQRELENTTAGWLSAPPEFHGVRTYRWACASPAKAHP